MKIIYISSLCSKMQLEWLEANGVYPSIASQNFNRNVANGFIDNGVEVTVLSNLPVTPNNHSRKLFGKKVEQEGELKYCYAPFINLPVIKHICVVLYTFFYILFWGARLKKEKVVVCDVLSKSGSIGAVLASLLLKIPIIGIVTDLPWMVVREDEPIKARPSKSFLYHFSHYVFLTEAMNPEVNVYKKPYIVVEGLAPLPDNSPSVMKNSPREILYAGSLMAKYGLKMLTDAFTRMQDVNACLVIYGVGPFEDDLREISKKYQNIIFKGSVPTSEVIEAEKRASLLVNPRPTHEEYTKYSFPSKNMEYMASGTPLLTTRLPGIPFDYNPFVFYFDDETTDGFCISLRKVLSLTDEALEEKGKQAKEYVMNNKNRKIQTERIIQLTRL